MSHNSLILEPGDTLYIGILKNSGDDYVEIRVANTDDQLLVTTPQGTQLIQ
jgi:hypothetical protein